jgi:hypothetical protein
MRLDAIKFMKHEKYVVLNVERKVMRSSVLNLQLQYFR